MQLLIESTTESQDMLLHDFTIFACERLEITNQPSFTFVDNTGGTSFGSYSPSEEAIIVATGNRHISDILRTLGHELVHHKQLSEGDNEMSLEELEYQANAVAGMLMRDYNKLHPEMFDLAVATPTPPGTIGDSQGSTFPDATRPSGPINMAEAHELVLWGLPKGKHDRLHEVVLSTQCKTQADLEKIKVRASKDGWHGFRVSHLDLSKKPDFPGALNEGMRSNKVWGPTMFGMTATEKAKHDHEQQEKKEEESYNSRAPIPHNRRNFGNRGAIRPPRHDKKYLKSIKEDAIVNSAGTGAVAGIGIGPQGEPGVPKKKTLKVFRRSLVKEYFDKARTKNDADAKKRLAQARAVLGRPTKK